MEQIKITDWIQALSSLVAVFVAIFAFYISRQTLHTPYRAIIKPKRFYPKDNVPTIDLFNIGPGVACNIKLYGLIKVRMGKRYYEYELTKAVGEDYLRPDTTHEYSITENYFVPGEPFFIEYETITGKTKIDVWQYKIINGKERFFKRGIFFKIRHLYFSKQFDWRES